VKPPSFKDPEDLHSFCQDTKCFWKKQIQLKSLAIFFNIPLFN